MYQESLLIFRELGDPVAASRVLDSMATLAAEQNRPEQALRLAAAGLRKSAGVRLSLHEKLHLDQLVESARIVAGGMRAAELWREGESLSLEEAVALSEQLR